MNKESVLTIESIDVSLKVFKPLKDFDSDSVKNIAYQFQTQLEKTKKDSLELPATIIENSAFHNKPLLRKNLILFVFFHTGTLTQIWGVLWS